MGLLDVLLGRKKLKDARKDKLWALTTARITMETELGLKPGDAAAVCFKPLSAADFVRAEDELQELLDLATTTYASRIRRRSDEFGFHIDHLSHWEVARSWRLGSGSIEYEMQLATRRVPTLRPHLRNRLVREA